MKIATVQINSGENIESNWKEIICQLKEVKKTGAIFVVLPENSLFMSDKQEDYKKIAEKIGEGKNQEYMANLAKELSLWIVLGAFPIIENDKVYQTCLVYDEQGCFVEYYHKRHLFNVTLLDSEENYNEPKAFNYGIDDKVINTPIGNVGLSICYDLRFPEHFRKLVFKGAEILLLPAAFTYQTGKAHWEILLRARAIENQCFVLAAAQTGNHPGKRKTWGHSMIIDPWGNIISKLTDEVGFCVASIDLKVLNKQRKVFPVLEHARN